MTDTTDSSRSLVLSYLNLRRSIGVLGFTLPFVLALGGIWIGKESELAPTISHYYYSCMGDVFVGTLCAIGVFLMSYRGPEPKDNIAGDMACVFAIGVALFPTTPVSSAPTFTGGLHFAFAAAFFLTLAYFSLILFTKTDATSPPTARKLLRNIVYKVCGYAILAAIAMIAIVKLSAADDGALAPYKPVFWLESVAVIAFGVSWLTKGEAILRDLPDPDLPD